MAVTSCAGAERLGQHDAIGDAPNRPLCGTRPANVDDWKCRVDLSGLLCNFPTIHRAAQTYIRNERAVLAGSSLEQGSPPLRPMPLWRAQTRLR
jgi:hypothetical protein